jgi:hypothetical protein
MLSPDRTDASRIIEVIMKHHMSPGDRKFQADFEANRIAPGSFDHRGHVRLAYTYLVEDDVETAVARMRDTLLSFLQHHGIDVSKYHETMTRAWILAVRHFMEICPPASSADSFIDSDRRMLDAKIMLTHYSAELLFSDEARARFVEPDLDHIPRYQS